MKMRRVNLLAALMSAGLFFAACSPKIPFTQGIRDEYKLTDEQIRSIQFYSSRDIVLNRGESSAEEQELKKGELQIKTGRYLEQVVIRAGTPGVAERIIDQKRIAVSFEPGDNQGLVFGKPADQYNDRYFLQAPEWKDGRGKIDYLGKTYYTATNSGDVFLLFKMKKLNQFKRDQRIAKGRKIK